MKGVPSSMYRLGAASGFDIIPFADESKDCLPCESEGIIALINFIHLIVPNELMGWVERILKHVAHLKARYEIRKGALSSFIKATDMDKAESALIARSNVWIPSMTRLKGQNE